MTGIGIAVGVATCGRPEGLARCLRALGEQTEPLAEVIVVDQGPTDEARSAVASCGLPGARYLEQDRLGLSASRNMALVSAGSDVLAVTDDDCVPDPGWTRAIASAFAREPAPDAVTGPVLTLGEQLDGTFAISMRSSETPVDHSGRSIPWGVGTGGNFAARTATLRDAGGWDERLGTGSSGRAAEDAELFERLLAAGAVIRYEPGAVVRHEWQTLERRLSTRWSYGYGIGALCGLALARRDPYALRMLGSYARMQLRPLARGVVRRDRVLAEGHVRALASLAPGVAYGIRASRRPRATSAAGLALDQR